MTMEMNDRDIPFSLIYLTCPPKRFSLAGYPAVPGHYHVWPGAGRGLVEVHFAAEATALDREDCIG